MKLFLALKKVQNHSSSGSHSRITKSLSSSQIYDSAAPAGGYPTSHLLAVFGKSWYIKWLSLIHWYQQWVTICHVLQNNFDNKQDGTLFSWVHIECAETENKTRRTFCLKWLLCTFIHSLSYYHIIILYIIEISKIRNITDFKKNVSLNYLYIFDNYTKGTQS